MVEERIYTVPLRRGFWKTPRYKRTNKAVKTLREFLARHMKVAPEQVKLGQHLNHFLWEDGIRNPPPRVKVTVNRVDDVVKAELFGKKYAAIEAPKERQEAPQGLKEKIQAAVGGKKDDSPEEIIEEAKEALEPEKKAETPESEKKKA